MTTTQSSPSRNTIAKLALFCMLVILPAMSWFYLDKGADFYRGVMAELGDYGEMPVFSFLTDGEVPITQADYAKQLTIVNFPTKETESESFEAMEYIHDAFKDHDGVLFLTFQEGADSSRTNRLPRQTQERKWRYLYGDARKIGDIRRQFIIPEALEGEWDGLENTLVMVDTNSVIRNFYTITDTAQLNRMVITMSLLMPREEKADIYFEPEKEM